jgi:hypothetical protein
LFFSKIYIFFYFDTSFNLLKVLSYCAQKRTYFPKKINKYSGKKCAKKLMAKSTPAKCIFNLSQFEEGAKSNMAKSSRHLKPAGFDLTHPLFGKISISQIKA